MALTQKVAEVFVEFLSKDGPLRKSFQSLGRMATDLKKSIGSIGEQQTQAASKVGASLEQINKKTSVIASGALIGIAQDVYNFTLRLAAWAEKTANELDRINAEAIAVGRTVSQLTNLNAALGIANAGWDTFARMQQRWNAETGSILRGTSEIALAMRMIGLEAKGSNGQVKDLATVLPEVADRLKAYNTESRLLLTHRIFGETSPEFLRLMAQGGDRFRTGQTEATLMGLNVNQNSTAVGNIMSTELGILWQQIKKLLQELFVLLSPLLYILVKILQIVAMSMIKTLEGLNLVISQTVQAFDKVKNWALSALTSFYNIPGIKQIYDFVVGAQSVNGGQQLSQAQRLLLGQGSATGPLSASFMGFSDLGRQALLSAVPPTGVADRMLIELKNQTNLLRVIAGQGSGFAP